MSAHIKRRGFVRRTLTTVGMSRWHVMALLMFQFVGTLFESFGLSMLLPVFQLMESGEDAATLAESSGFWRILIDAYAFIGLTPDIPALLGTSFLAIVARQVFVYIRLIYVARIRFLLVRRLRERAFRDFLNARLDHIESQGLGRIVNDLTVEMQVAVDCAVQTVQIAGYAVVCAVYVALLFALSVPITLAAIAVVAIASLPLVFLLREGRQVGVELVQANSALLSFVSERLRAIRLIRLSGTDDPELKNMYRRTARQYDRFMRGNVLRARTTVAMEPIIAAAAFIFLYLGTSAFNLELGTIGLFLLILLRIAPMIKEIVMIRFTIANGLGSFEQVERRMNGLRDAVESKGGTRPFTVLERVITYRDVTFEYAEQTAPALSGVSLSIPVGRITALVGPSGSGKSTLIDLLPRLREPSRGQILFDGVASSDFDLPSLRHAISYAPQAPQIFDVTVAEHIGYGSHDPDATGIEEAARLAGAHDFITRLPQGYDTPLGENGVRLSGGQKQRLDLARALMAHASILILDEPTSQLDAESERAFRRALARIRSETDMTIIVVAHRLSTVSIADQIVVLREGQVDRTGTHAELMAAGGWYAQAFHTQHHTDVDNAEVGSMAASAF